MSVFIDTPIWSYAYRRKKLTRVERLAVDALGNLIARQQASLIGPVRQEILTGFNEVGQFVEIRAVLRAFADVQIETEDYELGAELHDLCRRKGVQGSSTDFLICAMAVRRDASIFTTDGDFTHYARYTGVKLYQTADQ